LAWKKQKVLLTADVKSFLQNVQFDLGHESRVNLWKALPSHYFNIFSLLLLFFKLLFKIFFLFREMQLVFKRKAIGQMEGCQMYQLTSDRRFSGTQVRLQLFFNFHHDILVGNAPS
jgi:hypothetical protein